MTRNVCLLGCDPTPRSGGVGGGEGGSASIRIQFQVHCRPTMLIRNQADEIETIKDADIVMEMAESAPSN